MRAARCRRARARCCSIGRYEMGNGPRAISAFVALARKHGLDPAQMALAFATSRPFVTSTIIGATTLVQLKTDIDGCLIDAT
jgi:aryl-alcohol dehydrogenase-like predicted oxidoreductase